MQPSGGYMTLKKDIAEGIAGAIFASGIAYNSGASPTFAVASFILIVAVVTYWSIHKNNKNKNTKTGTSTTEK